MLADVRAVAQSIRAQYGPKGFRKNPKTGNEVKVVLALGSFDLLHYDHLMYIEQAKRCLERKQSYKGEEIVLVVGVKCDEAVRLKNSKRPIICANERAYLVDSLKPVDYTFIADYNPYYTPMFEADNEDQKAFLKIFESAFKELEPDGWYYENNEVLQSARDQLIDYYKIDGVAKTRGVTTSTTGIINTIIEKYDEGYGQTTG